MFYPILGEVGVYMCMREGLQVPRRELLASDSVLVHDGTGAIDGVDSKEIFESHSRMVTFAELRKKAYN